MAAHNLFGLWCLTYIFMLRLFFNLEVISNSNSFYHFLIHFIILITSHCTVTQCFLQFLYACDL